MINQAIYELKERFLEEWPIERLETMSIDEYTNLNKEDSFCYWVEARTNDLGSIWGGSSYKFGIFKRKDTTQEKYNDKRKSDGEYAWYGKYGNNKDEVFEKIRSLVVSIARNSMEDNLKAIDLIDLGDAYKWKIALLYGRDNVVNIFKLDALKFAADSLNYQGKSFSYSELNKFILSQKGNRDIFEFSKSLWKEYQDDTLDQTNENNFEYQTINPTKSIPLNQILYGPPGTGKTFITREISVKIANPEFKWTNDQELKMEYERLLNKGNIVFSTFHQSMSYEDFIEGIKPVLSQDSNDSDINYQIENGIFKTVAEVAKGISGKKTIDKSINLETVNYFKMSLGGRQRPKAHQWCLENNVVGLGWGDKNDFSELAKIDNWEEFRDRFKNDFPDLMEKSIYSAQAVRIFQKMEIGDIVVVSKGNYIIDALGVIEGEYQYDQSNPFGLYHLRKVRWLATEMNASPELFVSKNISQQSIYEFYNGDIKTDAFEKYFQEEGSTEELENYILIIDEINRGNISAIFGELITLIEDDKRIGEKNALQVKLPYSKTEFGVPNNLYIIGTMNTADRSVEALDSALRRRFSFIEKLPKPDLLEKITFGSFNLKQVLECINGRIEVLLDRDHAIGHSYFMNVESHDTEALKRVFKDKVIPLLQEYFYHDYEKIALVLGGGFVSVKRADNMVFPDIPGVDKPDVHTKIELIDNIDNIEEAINSLLLL